MPEPMPRLTEHDTETASEREARLEQDKANATTAGTLLQLHCGLLYYAVLFVAEPNRQGLQDEFNAWLQKAGADLSSPRHYRPAADAAARG